MNKYKKKGIYFLTCRNVTNQFHKCHKQESRIANGNVCTLQGIC